MMREMTPWNSYEVVLLALVAWREARGESDEAKIAVMHTVINRVDRPSWWGRSIVGVITKKFQYSSIGDPRDPQLTTWPQDSDHIFESCLNLADLVIRRVANSPLKGIDSYFDDSLTGDLIPKWAKEHPERFVGKIGRLNFYNLDCDTEDPQPNIKDTEA